MYACLYIYKYALFKITHSMMLHLFEYQTNFSRDFKVLQSFEV